MGSNEVATRFRVGRVPTHTLSLDYNAVFSRVMEPFGLGFELMKRIVLCFRRSVIPDLGHQRPN